MDTCSRLDEPEGVGWKDVNVGRLRTTTSGKQLIWAHRVATRSDRWPRSLAFAIRRCGADGFGEFVVARPELLSSGVRRGTGRGNSLPRTLAIGVTIPWAG